MSMSKNPFGEVFNFDWDKLVAVSRENAIAWGKAGKLAAEAAQAVTRRQVEMFQGQIETNSKLCENVVNAKSSEEALQQFSKVAKINTDTLIANSREIFELITKTSSDAVDVLKDRFSASLAECGVKAPSSSYNEKPRKNAAA